MYTFPKLVALSAIAGCGASAFAAGKTLQNVVQVAAGDQHSCALDSSGDVYCWGSNSFGQLGNGTTNFAIVAAHVVRSSEEYFGAARQVVTGREFTCALRTDASVWCWGQYGIGDASTQSLLPTHVEVGAPVALLAASNQTVCALLDTSQRSIKCWGRNDYGQLGDGTTVSRATPADVVIAEKDGSTKLLAGVIQIAAAPEHTCAVLDDGTVACWGENWLGQLANGTTADSTSPDPVVISDGGTTILSGVSSIASGGLQTCVRFAAKWQLACWGDNYEGQLGDPDVMGFIGSPVGVAVGTWPQPAAAAPGAQSLAVGDQFTCAVLADRRLACWGAGNHGELGNGSTSGSRTPLILTGIAPASSISAGTDHACAVMADATVECWGRGAEGELGNATTADSNTPVTVLQPD